MVIWHQYCPDENYARELQELFTLGKENNPNYSEGDVMAAARVLTGWKINGTINTYSFNSNQHDRNNKQFSSFYNNYVLTGRTGTTAGDLELDDLLNMIFGKSASFEIHCQNFIGILFIIKLMLQKQM
jgi:uncharacterized protein (DUF1800 family)